LGCALAARRCGYAVDAILLPPPVEPTAEAVAGSFIDDHSATDRRKKAFRVLAYEKIPDVPAGGIGPEWP